MDSESENSSAASTAALGREVERQKQAKLKAGRKLRETQEAEEKQPSEEVR